MTREEKELLLKDLCSRLPYEVILVAPNGKTVYQTDGNTGAELFVEEGWKPYLRSMDSMTDEERKEFNKVVSDSMNIDNISASVYVADWLYSKHLDVHGLIPKGLALEAPKRMYNI